MYDAQSGNVYCDWCHALLGNINGEGNYFALIRTKYCPECRRFARSDSNRAAQRAYRKRKRLEKQQLIIKSELLQEENRLLRERIKELRRNEL
ncbi:bZIP transcription factor [Ruminococcus sp.]|uniref:bZIP transcription factor n=1 Tax=Ruminococcus sp. TaxID=41978 RepID=UPI001B77424E|nr:bZIP transcription factor [Ruminococcus sp.]MBP5431570.1 hypothetical protein [Ruminococcus sp.]